MIKCYVIGSLVGLLLLSIMPFAGSPLPFHVAYVFVTLIAIVMMRKKIFIKHPLLYFTIPFFAILIGTMLQLSLDKNPMAQEVLSRKTMEDKK